VAEKIEMPFGGRHFHLCGTKEPRIRWRVLIGVTNRSVALAMRPFATISAAACHNVAALFILCTTMSIVDVLRVS